MFAVNPETEKALRKHIIIKLKFTSEETGWREWMLSLISSKIMCAATQINVFSTRRRLQILSGRLIVPQPCKPTQRRLQFNSTSQC